MPVNLFSLWGMYKVILVSRLPNSPTPQFPQTSLINHIRYSHVPLTQQPETVTKA